MILDGRVAVVTGGGRGLGLAIATHLVGCGASVFVLDLNEDALASLPKGITGISVDLLDASACQAAMTHVVSAAGGLDVLVNSAGVILSRPMVNVLDANQLVHPPESFSACMESNLQTTFNATAFAVEQMVRSRSRGVVVNISSISARGNPGQTAYSASKAGVNALTKVWAREWGPLGIRCNAVAPGFIDSPGTRGSLSAERIGQITRQTPVGRLGRPDEVADAVEFLVRNEFMNGAILELDGGLVL